MKQLFYLIFTCLFLFSCHKKLAKDGVIYVGKIHYNSSTYFDGQGEFIFHTLKENDSQNTFSLLNDTISLNINIEYDKKTKEIIGSFKDIYINVAYTLRGKKIGSDFILGIFYLDIANENSDGFNQKLGSIYLTPKS